MATSTGLHRTHRYYAPSPLKQLPIAAAEFKLDLIGYVTAKMPFNSPKAASFGHHLSARRRTILTFLAH